MASLLVTGGSLVTPAGIERKDVMIRDGTLSFDVSGTADDTVDARGKLLFPGLIDCHVHFREPGYEHKATMRSEVASAMAGGILTVCEMPNTDPPTVSVAALADKVRRAEEIPGFDLRFFFGITAAAHLEELSNLFAGTSEEVLRLRRHCCGVKIYLEHSTGNQGIDWEIIDSVFSLCGSLGIPVVAHCEDPDTVAKASARIQRTDIAAHSAMRPPEAEAKAVEAAISYAREHETMLHVAHLSTMQGADLVRQAKRDQLPVTCEVAPHHLFLSTEDYETLNSLGKMNPPLRTKDHGEALWAAIADGTVDCIATDHAPHTLEEKKNPEPLKAPSGVPGVETMLPLLLTVMSGHFPSPSSLQATSYKLQADDILRLCFTRPNEIFSLKKQGLVDGAKTPVVLVDPAAEWEIRAADLHSKCGWTPYEGWKVRGRVERVV